VEGRDGDGKGRWWREKRDEGKDEGGPVRGEGVEKTGRRREEEEAREGSLGQIGGSREGREGYIESERREGREGPGVHEPRCAIAFEGKGTEGVAAMGVG